MQPDPLGPRLPAGDLVDHRHPGAAAVPGVRSGDGSSWVGHGRSASMEKLAVCGVLLSSVALWAKVTLEDVTLSLEIEG